LNFTALTSTLRSAVGAGNQQTAHMPFLSKAVLGSPTDNERMTKAKQLSLA